MTTKYFALTIGPIYETMKKASKTRSLWASSYMFSYLIREIAEGIRKEVKEENYIMPVIGPSLKNGAGLYPDRIIAVIPDTTSFAKLETIVNDVIDRFAQEVTAQMNAVTNTEYDEEATVAFLRSYIRCICREYELNDGDNIILNIHNRLDEEELKPKIALTDADAVFRFINNVNGREKDESTGFMVTDGFGFNRIRFDSILEVAAKTLCYNDNKHGEHFNSIFREYENKESDIDEEILKKLRNEFPKEYRPYQKYVAIVHADGDNIGKTIKAIGHDKELVKKFSAFLHRFALKATDRINEYGGLPIYMGGDDMLFFAPVAVKEDDRFETIFDLCNKLDEFFVEKLKELATQIPVSFRQSDESIIGDIRNPTIACPTLSYGISVTFYKYPLYEALKISHDKLWHLAKNPDIHPDKNTLSFRLQKHSGQVIEADFEKRPGGIYRALSDLVTKWTRTPHLKEGFLNSVVTRLDFLSPLFEAAVEEKIPLKHFFDNHFNEDPHQRDPTQEFLNDIRNIVPLVFTGNVAANKIQLYTALRFIHFINTENDDK